MSLFTRNRKTGVRSFILQIINNNCPKLDALVEGPRLESRANLAIPVLVVPVEGKRPSSEKAFTAVTKEFSTTGVALVLQRPVALDEAVLGFRWEREMHFVWSKAKHLSPIGGGFFQLGFQMTEIVHVGDYPELDGMTL